MCAVSELMLQFFHTMFLKVHNFSNVAGSIPQPKDSDIIYMYLQTAGVGFHFSMNYVGWDQMTLGGC